MRRQIPSLSSLQAFEASARRSSFTLAAADLSLTQSAVSRQVITLERLLGVRLFKREAKALVLTDAGASFLDAITPALNSLEAAAISAAAGRRGRGGVLELAVSPTFATRWLIPRLPDFLRSHRAITVNLTTRIDRFDFAESSVHAAIQYGESNWPGAQCDALMGEEVVTVCSPKIKKHLRHPRDLGRYSLLHLRTRPHAWRDWFESVGEQGVNADVGPRFELFSMVAQAAAASLGVAVVPRFLVIEELRARQLVEAFPHRLHSRFAYCLAYPPSRTRYPPLMAFRAWLLASVGNSTPG